MPENTASDIEQDNPEAPARLRQKFLEYKKFALLSPLGLILLFWWLFSAPFNSPTNVPVQIERGLSASNIADELYRSGVVRSGTALYLVLVALQKDESVKAGTYVFTEPLSLFEVANRITESVPPDTLTVLTFPEGFSVKEYAEIAAKTLRNFNAEEFIFLTSPYEGFLFPETYHVPVDYSPLELFELLGKTYEEKTDALQNAIDGSELTEKEIVTLASLVEREANTKESMALVAGILLRRLEIGMALQVDASMEYVLQKPLQELTPEDLQIDSPYNTYLYPGLPPTPIGNPGLQSITAVLNPIKTDYLYYLTDEEGNFHYAKTFDEHKNNIARYLR